MKKSIGANTIAYPAPAWVVGTYDKDGRPNMMAAAWAGICCSRPPCVSVALRSATYSHGSILLKQAFTVNVPSEKQVRETDYFGLVSGRREDKIAAAGLTPVKSELVDAPYLEEFPLVLECRLVQAVEAGLHTVFIGEIKDVKAEESVLGAGGLPDIEKVRPVIYAYGNQSYYGIGKNLGHAFALGKELKK